MASPAPRGPGSPPEQQQQALPPAPPPAIRSRVSYMDQAEHHAAEAAGGGGGPEAPLPEHVVQAIADVHRPDTSEHPQRPSTRESRPTTRERHAGSSVGFSRESTLRRPGTHETDRSSAWERSHLGSRIKHRSLSHSKSRRARSYMTIESTDGTKVCAPSSLLPCAGALLAAPQPACGAGPPSESLSRPGLLLTWRRCRQRVRRW